MPDGLRLTQIYPGEPGLASLGAPAAQTGYLVVPANGVIGASVRPSPAFHWSVPLARHKYGIEKRQRELSKEKKKEEKRQRKLERSNTQEGTDAAEAVTAEDGIEPDPQP